MLFSVLSGLNHILHKYIKPFSFFQCFGIKTSALILKTVRILPISSELVNDFYSAIFKTLSKFLVVKQEPQWADRVSSEERINIIDECGVNS